MNLVRPFASYTATFAQKKKYMNANNTTNRRDFIRTSVVTGGALLASTAIPGQAMNLLQDQKNGNRFSNDGLLKGVCDNRSATYGRPIVIEDKVWIGINATVLPGVRIGYGSIIGANSVVTHDVPPMTVVGGNPARFIKRIEAK